MLIDFNTLWPKYNINPKGVLHIGASHGQETAYYVNLGVRDVVYIEALLNVFEQLVEHVKKFNGKFTCINACISDVDNEEVIFNVTNNEGQSSSMLDFGTHSKQHPTVKVIDTIKLKTTRVDSLYNAYNLSGYDFLNIDLQCAELLALKSMGTLLNDFKWIYLEVNRAELYKGCPMYTEVFEYLKQFGFTETETKWTNHGWGDSLLTKTI